MNSIRKTLTTAAVLAATAAAGIPAAAQASTTYLQSPSGNIVCKSKGHLLSCDVKSAGISYNVLRNGHAWVDSLHGYSGGYVAQYGTSFQRHGFLCYSDTTGMTCDNRSYHGFFMSREQHYTY